MSRALEVVEMFNTPESATAAVERYEALPEVTVQEVDNAAEFIEACLKRRGGVLSAVEVTAWDFHAEAMAVELDCPMEDCDETHGAFLSRLALTDPAEAGILLAELSRNAINQIANERFEEFEFAAREAGYIKE